MMRFGGLVCRFVLGFALLGVVLAMALPAVAQERGQTGSEGVSGEPGVVARPKLTLPRDVADKVGHQVWLNETGGNAGDIVAWNNGEEFASLGIGHFIWFPAGKPAPVR
jgi:hypothetical protein